MIAHNLAEKFRRALRNGTGATFSNADLRALGRMGVLLVLAEEEARELCGEPADLALPIASAAVVGAAGGSRVKSHSQATAVEQEVSDRPFSPKTLAARWSCSATKIRSMCHSGELASFTQGKMIRIAAAEVARFEGQAAPAHGAIEAKV